MYPGWCGRPWGHPGTGRARPPRCLVRWQCDSPRSLLTSRRGIGRDLGRNSAVYPAVSEPFLSRFSTQMDENSVFEGQKHLLPHLQRRTRWSLHHPHPSARRARRDIRNGMPCVRARISKNSKNTESGTQCSSHGTKQAPSVVVKGVHNQKTCRLLRWVHFRHPA